MGYGYQAYLQPNVIPVNSDQEIGMYQLAPSAIYAFFKRDEQIIYYVTTDSLGKASMQILDYTIRPDANTARHDAELKELRERLAAIESMLGGLINESTVSKRTANVSADGQNGAVDTKPANAAANAKQNSAGVAAV